ncbi:MAG: hypothetical protein ACFFD5_16745 [Candidatus Thorarchaeota archaeon]
MDSRKPAKNSDILLKYCEDCVKSKIANNNTSHSDKNKVNIKKPSANL